MEREKSYGERPAEESEFHLRIPEGPASLEDTGGAVLYPEGPAFVVFGSNFQEGTPPTYTLHAGPAHYIALMLCLHPTVFFGEIGDMQLASYEVLQSLESGCSESGGFVDYPVVLQKAIPSIGEIFMLKLNYYPHKVSHKIRIFPAPDGRNTVYFGGRLGTFPSPSETL